MATSYVPPSAYADRFNCPFCGAFSHQIRTNLRIQARVPGSGISHHDFSDDREAFAVSGSEIQSSSRNAFSAYTYWVVTVCASCTRGAVWRGDMLVYPAESAVDQPHPQMPETARELYDEARLVLPHSRRAAAALARACLEVILRELDSANAGRRLDEMLAAMQVRLGETLWKLLTALRVVGNDALHGDADDLVVLFLDGDHDVVVEPLFGAINAIVEKEIAQPAAAEALYALIPQTKREAAERKAARLTDRSE